MHVIFRESHGLEETETPTDLGQSPADLVVLSFSDSDLGAFAEGWHRGGGPEGGCLRSGWPIWRRSSTRFRSTPTSSRPSAAPKGILIRLIGGVPYWAYGMQQVQALWRRRRASHLASCPPTGARMRGSMTVSTLSLSQPCGAWRISVTPAARWRRRRRWRNWRWPPGFMRGRCRAPRRCRRLAPGRRSRGVYCPLATAPPRDTDTRRIALITFYRSYLVAADTGTDRGAVSRV